MPTTSNMSLVLPVEGGSQDIWDTLLNAALTLVDEHDHSTGKGVKVPSAGLKINADVSWSFSGTRYAITDAKAVDFEPQAASAVSSYSSALFANSDDSNNLYFRNSAGTNVKITDGSTLNISIVGGIGGDYTSIGALLDYDDATDTYRFRQQTSASVRQFAKVSCSNVQLFEYLAAGASPVPTNSVRLASPAALAASYTVTFPGAVPGANGTFLQATTAGVLSFSNTTTADITAAEFHHTDVLVHHLPASAFDDAGTHTRNAGGTSGAHNRWTTAASTNAIWAPICIPSGSRITGWSLFCNKISNGSTTITGQIYRTQVSTVAAGTEAALGSGNSSAANAPGAVTLSENGLTIDMADGFEYYLVFTPTTGTASDILYSGQIAYTRP